MSAPEDHYLVTELPRVADCMHVFLAHQDKRTTCRNCGRDGFVFMDIDPQDIIDELRAEIKELKELMPRMVDTIPWANKLARGETIKAYDAEIKALNSALDSQANMIKELEAIIKEMESR